MRRNSRCVFKAREPTPEGEFKEPNRDHASPSPRSRLLEEKGKNHPHQPTTGLGPHRVVSTWTGCFRVKGGGRWLWRTHTEKGATVVKGGGTSTRRRRNVSETHLAYIPPCQPKATDLTALRAHRLRCDEQGFPISSQPPFHRHYCKETGCKIVGIISMAWAGRVTGRPTPRRKTDDAKAW